MSNLENIARDILQMGYLTFFSIFSVEKTGLSFMPLIPDRDTRGKEKFTTELEFNPLSIVLRPRCEP